LVWMPFAFFFLFFRFFFLTDVLCLGALHVSIYVSIWIDSFGIFA
jgi:hypothetical protein